MIISLCQLRACCQIPVLLRLRTDGRGRASQGYGPANGSVTRQKNFQRIEPPWLTDGKYRATKTKKSRRNE
jgi:hypothetical protein